MKKYYDQDKHDDNFKVGDLVAYYVGDRAAVTAKFHRRFTGPWKVISRLSHNTLEIKNEETGEQLSCHVSMLKKYYQHKFIPLAQYEKSQEKQDRDHIEHSQKHSLHKELKSKVKITKAIESNSRLNSLRILSSF